MPRDIDRLQRRIRNEYVKQGRSEEEADRIAWATLNKRGLLDRRKEGRGNGGGG